MDQLSMYYAASKRDSIDRANWEFGEYVNFDAISANFLGHKEEDWFYDRIKDAIADPESAFSREDSDKFAQALLKIAGKMQRCANDILATKYLTLDEMPDDEILDLSMKVYEDDRLLRFRLEEREQEKSDSK
ncbi:MAG: hypothetical protein MJZ66_08390 [Bacteroidales bacterium]|nr:hypothetical protein [Bacteroidales bacterium]